MSGKMGSGNPIHNSQEHTLRAKPKHRKPDARASRTRNRLGMAFLELIHERPIENVTVQDVLDRASAGRSTFDLHFRDKNHLLLSQLQMIPLIHEHRGSSSTRKSRFGWSPWTEMFSPDYLERPEKAHRPLPSRCGPPQQTSSISRRTNSARGTSSGASSIPGRLSKSLVSEARTRRTRQCLGRKPAVTAAPGRWTASKKNQPQKWTQCSTGMVWNGLR